VLALLFAGVASAQDDEATAYDRTGWQVGGGFLAAFPDLDSGASFDTAYGLDLRAAYRMIPNWSLEVQYAWGGTFDSNVQDVSSHLLTANSKLHILTGRVQPYVLVGIGILRSDLGRLDPKMPGLVYTFGGRASAGVDVHVTPHFGVYAEGGYVFSADELRPLRYGTAATGLFWQF